MEILLANQAKYDATDTLNKFQQYIDRSAIKNHIKFQDLIMPKYTY